MIEALPQQQRLLRWSLHRSRPRGGHPERVRSRRRGSNIVGVLIIVVVVAVAGRVVDPTLCVPHASGRPDCSVSVCGHRSPIVAGVDVVVPAENTGTAGLCRRAGKEDAQGDSQHDVTCTRPAKERRRRLDEVDWRRWGWGRDST